MLKIHEALYRFTFVYGKKTLYVLKIDVTQNLLVYFNILIFPTSWALCRSRFDGLKNTVPQLVSPVRARFGAWTIYNDLSYRTLGGQVRLTLVRLFFHRLGCSEWSADAHRHALGPGIVYQNDTILDRCWFFLILSEGSFFRVLLPADPHLQASHVPMNDAG